MHAQAVLSLLGFAASCFVIDVWLRSIDWSLWRAVCYVFFASVTAVWDFCNGVFRTRMVVEVVENNGNVALLKTSHGHEVELFRKHQNLSPDEFVAKFPVGKLFPAHASIRLRPGKCSPIGEPEKERLHEWIRRVGLGHWLWYKVICGVWRFILDGSIGTVEWAILLLEWAGL